MRRALAGVGLIGALAGCGGTIRTADGVEPIRGALWFGPDAVGEDASQMLVVLANSPFPCAAEDVADDPATSSDEAAAAAAYWQAQLGSALAREGAWVVVLRLVSRGTDPLGVYPLDPTALDDPDGALAGLPRVGFGAWAHVVESAVTATDGLVSAYAITTLDEDVAEAPGVATLDALSDGGTLSGTAALLPADVSVRFDAERCTNADLAGVVLERALRLITVVPA